MFALNHLRAQSRLVQGVWKILPYSKFKKIVLTMDVRPNNVLNEQQFGYCVKVELYIRSVSSETTDFLASLLEVTEKTKKN